MFGRCSRRGSKSSDVKEFNQFCVLLCLFCATSLFHALQKHDQDSLKYYAQLVDTFFYLQNVAKRGRWSHDCGFRISSIKIYALLCNH